MGPAAATPAGSPLCPLPQGPPHPPGPRSDLQPVARSGRENGEDEESQRPQARAGAHGVSGARPRAASVRFPSGRQVGAARTGWGAGPGRAAGLSLPAAGRAARCCARCPADPTVSAAPEPGCGGSGGGGRAAGGAGRGRAEDGVTWAGPAARDTPPNGGGPEPAGLGFSWGASPARRPGALGAPARCRHAWPHAAQLGRARGAATQLLGPRPGP